MKDSKLVPEVRTLTDFLNGLVRIRRFDMVVELFDDIILGFGVQPDVYSYTAFLKSLCELKDVDRAKEVVNCVENKGVELNVVIYNVLIHGPALPQCFPSFSHGGHCITCSELKQLYVAITRTRQRLWICENQEENSKPMFDYWKKLCLVQVKKVDDSLAQAMQMASSPAESGDLGLYGQKNYEMATLCFERAGDTYWEKRAKASALRATADYMRASNTKEACSILQEAAEIFYSIGRAESAAECFCELGDLERAGRIYLEKCGESELIKAGECFTVAKCYKEAAEAYEKANYFSDCLAVCKVGKLFDIGLQYIESWKKRSLQYGNSTGRCEKWITLNTRLYPNFSLLRNRVAVS